jgi:5'-phosphate synthase pdxT subunit
MRRICCRHVASDSSIGVLALQGDYAAHARMLSACGVEVREVRKSAHLAGLDGLVLPGGETSALLKLMESTDLEEELVAFHAAGGALFGTCAGMILLAAKVCSPAQRSLALMDIDVERNAYGRQIDSFESVAEWLAPDLAVEEDGTPLPLVFIRAPRLVRSGKDVQPLARCRDDVVLARQGRVLVASFHPEMSHDLRVHRLFLKLVRQEKKGRLSPAGP